ncbi:Inner membrane protein YiaV precursor [Rosistilla carotiformis]|uniref:Inner membrane protein YiaV n=1 Tax=Rosistilla carotiformis TaxID=2528017 RepID=A0A518JTR1_9BACT|nr:HlyD family efflux transporter periplasmic adaptor subunit [Rosistilla carotiformis]QDV68941.1 Inner membrane protein YiaV precursor [Rosistilla carotiformis]
MNESNVAARRSRVHLFINFAVSASVLTMCVIAYTKLGKRERPAMSKPPKPAATVVDTEALRIHEGPVSLTANGVVVPLREIRLATEVPGRVVELSPNMRAGRMVEKDEVLVRLDPIEYELEVQRLVSQQNQEAAELEAIDVSIQNTDQLVALSQRRARLTEAASKRAHSLIQQNAASIAEVDAAEEAELSASAAVVELQNRRRELEAQRKLIVERQASTEVARRRAQLDLDRTVVRAPIRGRVVMSNVEEQSFVAAGTSFVTIEDVSAVEVRSNLTVEQMYWVWNARNSAANLEEAGSSAAHHLPEVNCNIEYRLGNRTYQWAAVLKRIDGAGIDQDTRTFPCLFRVDDPEAVERVGANAFPFAIESTADRSLESPGHAIGVDGPRQLLRGMFVSVHLHVDATRPLYRVSESAIRPGDRIWINRDGKMRIVQIEVVGQIDGDVIVDARLPERQSAGIASSNGEHNGVSPADVSKLASVIVSPVNDPRDGLPVMTAKARDSKAKRPPVAAVGVDSPATDGNQTDRNRPKTTLVSGVAR